MASSEPSVDGDSWWRTSDQYSRLENEFQNDLLEQGELEASRGKAYIYCGKSSLGNPGEVIVTTEINTFRRTLDRLIDRPVSSLIILEDLGRYWVEWLGRVLDIPVYVFAQHWALPEDHILGGARPPIGQSVERHFVLNYTQTLPFKILNKSDGLYSPGISSSPRPLLKPAK
jgi:hypothetical protein